MAAPLVVRRQKVTHARAAYAALGLLILGPVLAFVVAGTDSSAFRLDGAGGPLIAFSAGVLSFLSPCVLPLVPIYITHLAGASVVNGVVVADRKRTFSHAVAFVGGLSLVFVTLGASVGLIGFFLTDHQVELREGSGVLLIAMGALIVPSYGERSPRRSGIMLAGLAVLFVALVQLADLQGDRGRMLILVAALAVFWARFSGYLKLPVLSRTFQFDPAAKRSAGYARSGLVGAAFATGWTPCVGPILGGILTLAATSGHAWTGAYLLAAYSAGFSIPFLVTGLAVADVSKALRKVQPYMPAFEVASGVMMVGLGVLLLSGRLTALNGYFNFAGFNQGL